MIIMENPIKIDDLGVSPIWGNLHVNDTTLEFIKKSPGGHRRDGNHHVENARNEKEHWKHDDNNSNNNNKQRPIILHDSMTVYDICSLSLGISRNSDGAPSPATCHRAASWKPRSRRVSRRLGETKQPPILWSSNMETSSSGWLIDDSSGWSSMIQYHMLIMVNIVIYSWYLVG